MPKAQEHLSNKSDDRLLRHKIVETLLADIFSGHLEAGRQLFTQELADRFNVSHTPIREALISLAGIGIIDLIPNRTAIVRGVTPAEVREVLQVRRALECEAIRLACGRIPLDALQELWVQIEPLTKPDLSQPTLLVEHVRHVDSRLHDLIADSCGNRLLASELNRLKILFRAFRDASWSEYESRNDFRRVADEAYEHLVILDALRAANRSAASRAMARHLRGGVKDWTYALPESVGSPGMQRKIAGGARRSSKRSGAPG